MVDLHSITLEVIVFLNFLVSPSMKHYGNIIRAGPSIYCKCRQKIDTYVLESYSCLIFFSDLVLLQLLRKITLNLKSKSKLECPHNVIVE